MRCPDCEHYICQAKEYTCNLYPKKCKYEVVLTDFEKYYIKAQEKWETEGNSTQLDGRQIKICWKLLKEVI